MTNFEIRIDYVQHNISSLLGYCRLVGETGKIAAVARRGADLVGEGAAAMTARVENAKSSLARNETAVEE